MDTQVMTQLMAFEFDELNLDQRHVVEKAWRKLCELVGPDHPKFLDYLAALAQHYEAQRKYTKAEAIYRMTLILTDRKFPKGHPNRIHAAVALADYYYRQGQYCLATPFYEQAIKLDEAAGCDGAIDPQALARLYLCQTQCVKGLEQIWP